ncbi:MAG: hypothetical protein K6E21_00410 [Bacilli bacterium]|nr:hypothetical protein [Bacilli bacterium]
MKKSILFLLPILLTSCGGKDSYYMNESNFFLVMTNIQYYPEEYVNKELEFDSFTYKLTSTSNEEFFCVVRKCASGFGCKCGKDTIIGFVVDKDLGLPEPKNQYENTNDKSWVHINGTLETTNKVDIEILGADDIAEKVSFLTLKINSFTLIEDYSSLNYYVDK